MKKYIICNTHELYCDDIEFTCKDNEDPELVAEGVLESHGYSEFCDENGFYSYDFDLVEVSE
ncbi:hypothetical protein [Streptococcus porcinus]|uniref:Uncharacterized protein n=1 Tax=Streptococcus porcinus TaxID=1340 RepID=A0A7W0ARS7_STRPO|nr:hypothetical protein [Streptococcus porcinus]MBA2796576.1 hypothetical protein [Streptococcus porcinus]